MDKGVEEELGEEERKLLSPHSDQQSSRYGRNGCARADQGRPPTSETVEEGWMEEGEAAMNEE